MSYIVFNNVGNRHIKYEGKELEKKGILSQTKKLWENYENEKDKIEVQIISDFFSSIGEVKDFLSISIVTLFATLQEENNYQDTYYIAKIIQEKLKEEFPEIEVYIEKVFQNPSNAKLIYPEYVEIFKKYMSEYPELDWIFLDSGGTPQQKTVCKLLFPLFEGKKTEVFYLGHLAGQAAKLRKVEDYEKTIETLLYTKKAVLELIKNGHYTSAYELLRREDNKSEILPLLKLGNLRINNQSCEKGFLNNFSDKKWRKNNKEWGKEPLIVDFINRKSVISFPELEKSLDREDYFRIGEFFLRADFYLQRKFYNQFVLNFQQGIEVLLISFIWKFAQKNGKNIKKKKDDVNQFMKEYLQEEIKGTLSYQLKFALEVTEGKEKLHSFFYKISRINNSYLRYIEKTPKDKNLLDTLRNNLVHRGENVKTGKRGLRKPLLTVIDNFLELKEKFLNLDNTFYDNLNKFVAKNIF